MPLPFEVSRKPADLRDLRLLPMMGCAEVEPHVEWEGESAVRSRARASMSSGVEFSRQRVPRVSLYRFRRRWAWDVGGGHSSASSPVKSILSRSRGLFLGVFEAAMASSEVGMAPFSIAAVVFFGAGGLIAAGAGFFEGGGGLAGPAAFFVRQAGGAGELLRLRGGMLDLPNRSNGVQTPEKYVREILEMDARTILKLSGM